ncbi:MAG TPA: hypothetical protein VG248_14665 [Caulobacteraceae bacterium]|jgi:hypothetical protein|nr:hypothetical protein [Caulobacteraceae bacterium]
MTQPRLHALRPRRSDASLSEEDRWARLAIGALVCAPVSGVVTGWDPLVLALIGGAVLAEAWAVVLRIRSLLRDEIQ